MAFKLLTRCISYRAVPLKGANSAEASEGRDLIHRGFFVSVAGPRGGTQLLKEPKMPVESKKFPQLPRNLLLPDHREIALFALGQIVATPAVLKHFEHTGIDPMHYIRQHSFGVWGDVTAEDARENDFSVVNGNRVLSAYTLAGVKFWIITEADRSMTMMLLPSEY